MNKIDTGDMDTSRPPFKNYIEVDWETLNRQDDDVTVWLRDKYNGMILHDGEDGDDHEPRRASSKSSGNGNAPKATWSLRASSRATATWTSPKKRNKTTRSMPTSTP